MRLSRDGGVNTMTAQVIAAVGVGSVIGSTLFNLDSSGCNTGFFKPAYTVLGLGGKITWATGQADTPFSLGVTTGVGTIGQISAFTSAFTSLGNVQMKDEARFDGKYTKRVPASICVNFTAVFVRLALPLLKVECSYQMCTPLTPSSTGGIVLGTGTVNWSDVTTGTPTLTPL